MWTFSSMLIGIAWSKHPTVHSCWLLRPPSRVVFRRAVAVTPRLREPRSPRAMSDTSSDTGNVTVSTPLRPAPTPPPQNASVTIDATELNAIQPSPTIAALPEHTPTSAPPQNEHSRQPEAQPLRARTPQPDLTAADVALYRREVECKQQFTLDIPAEVAGGDARIPPDNNRDGDDDAHLNGPYQIAGRDGRAVRSTHTTSSNVHEHARAAPSAPSAPTHNNVPHVIMPHKRLNPTHISPIGIPHKLRYLNPTLLASIPTFEYVQQCQFSVTFFIPFDKYKNIAITNRWLTNATLLLRAAIDCPSFAAMRDLHPSRRPPAYNAVNGMTAAKVVFPKEHEHKALQTLQQHGDVRVRLVLHYPNKEETDAATRVFADNQMMVTSSYPSSYCGKVYNVPIEMDAPDMHRYIWRATGSLVHADSIAVRRIYSPMTNLATTTMEWAALSDAADAICNVQIPTKAPTNQPLGFVWRVATRTNRLPDTLVSNGASAQLFAPLPPPPPPHRSYAAAAATGAGTYQQTTTGIVVSHNIAAPAPPPQSAPQYDVAHSPPDHVVTTLLKHITDMNKAAELRAKEQNEFNQKLLHQMNTMMKASIDQFANQMQLFHTVLTSHANALTSLTMAVNRSMPVAATNPPSVPSTPSARQSSSVRSRTRNTSSSPTQQRVGQRPPVTPVPERSPLRSDATYSQPDHSPVSPVDAEVSPIVHDIATEASMLPLTFSLTTTSASSTSDVPQALAQSLSLHSVTSDADTVLDADADTGIIVDPPYTTTTTTDSSNVTRHTLHGTVACSPTDTMTSKTSALQRPRRTMSNKNDRTQEERQRDYESTRPPPVSYTRLTAPSKSRKSKKVPTQKHV